MDGVSKYVMRSVIRLVWAESVRGLTVLLLGGVLVTMLVRAVEGQGTRDPATQPVPFQVAAGDSGKSKTTNQRRAPSSQHKPPEPDASASYVVPVPRGTTSYSGLDDGLQRAQPSMFEPCPPELRGTGFDKLKKDFLEKPRTWGKVSLPADIQKVLGNAQVYVMTGGGNVRQMWGVRQARYYDLAEKLNQFVVDCGQLWTPDNAAELVRVYAFLLAADGELRLENSFAEDDFVAISPGRLESLVTGRVPLVPSFQVRSVKPHLGSDRGSTPAGTISTLTAVIDWGDRQASAMVEFANVCGFPMNTFPERWRSRGSKWPIDILLDIPEPAGRPGDAGTKTFRVSEGPGVQEKAGDDLAPDPGVWGKPG